MDKVKEYLLVKIGSYDEEDIVFPNEDAAKEALRAYKKNLIEADSSLEMHNEAENEFSVSCGDEFQAAWVTEKPVGFFAEMELLLAKAYAGLDQYAFELQDSSTCRCHLEEMEEMVKREATKRGSSGNVHFEVGGRSFDLTQDELDAAYFYKDMQYGMEDAKSQLNRVCFGSRNMGYPEVDDLPADAEKYLAEFQEVFGVSFDTALQNLDQIYDTYGIVQASDRSDDENWEEAIAQACHAIGQKFKMSEKDAMRYLNTLKPGITKEEFLADCRDMGIWFDEIQPDPKLMACYEALKP